MMRVHIAHEFAVRSPDGRRLPGEDLHKEGERLMEELLTLEEINEDVEDAATSTEADRGVVIVELLVTAGSAGDALTKFLTIARTAIHAIGGATPGWDTPAQQRADYEPQGVQLEYA